jgi:hypothetical protein
VTYRIINKNPIKKEHLYECPVHGEVIGWAYKASDIHTCPKPGCWEPVGWIPSLFRVEGEGWFKPGYDWCLGGSYNSPDERRALMKKRGAAESYGGGDIQTQEPPRKDALGVGRFKPLPLPERRDDAGYKAS